MASRRGADELVAAGRVTVDGRPAVLGQKVDPAEQAVEVDGRRSGAESRPRYLALHKPAGVTSTVQDRHAATTVIDLVPADLSAGVRLYPVGRLDQDTEGLILLTNDGDWAEHVLHPRYGVEREYAVALSRPLTREQAEALETGVELDEGVATVTGLRGQTDTEDRLLAELLEPAPEPRLTWVRVTLHQGWKRQLRRMFGEVERAGRAAGPGPDRRAAPGRPGLGRRASAVGRRGAAPGVNRPDRGLTRAGAGQRRQASQQSKANQHSSLRSR